MANRSQTTWNPLEEAKTELQQIRLNGGTTSKRQIAEIAALLDEALADYTLEQEQQ